jgi:hypothetical protein
MYVPQPGCHLARTVKGGSAIVGKPAEDGYVLVYYEGNLYGAVNMVTFADRALHAYERMAHRYPTVACALVRQDDLRRVASFYPEYGRVEVEDATQLVDVARWLGLDVTDKADRDRLHSELRRSSGPARAA